MFRIIVAGLAQVDRRCLLDQEHVVRSMRGVTGCTLAVIDRLMFRRRMFLLINGIGMALSAHIDQFGLQQGFFGSRMRTMAIKTAYFVHQGPMNPVLGQCIIDE